MAVLGAKLCRQTTVFFVCIVDFLWLLANHLINSKLKKTLLLLFLASFFLWLWHSSSSQMDGTYSPWNPSSPIIKPLKPKVFVRGADDDIYMYSAIANYHQPYNEELNVIITSLDATRSNLMCCVYMDNSTLYRTAASEYFNYHSIDLRLVAWFQEYFHHDTIYYARQHTCTIPQTGHMVSHVSMTSKSCSRELTDYLPVTYPQQVPGGLALCAKIAHSGGIDPEKFIEWMEVQRIQGVDKVLIFDLGNPDSLMRVFRYYQDLGILDVQPYELPGLPAGRTLMERDKHNDQFHHDETMAVMECRQRMAGYTYVMSHDVDEFIIPRADVDLKTFFKKKMEVHKDAAGFFFNAEFFIYNWGPTNSEEDLMLTRYRKTTLPHWECTKYVYLPSRTISSTTHSIYPRKSFTSYIIPSEEAILHHYRECPEDTWGHCFPEMIIDHVMTRFPLKHKLYERVRAVRQATNTITQWTVSKASEKT